MFFFVRLLPRSGFEDHIEIADLNRFMLEIDTFGVLNAQALRVVLERHDAVSEEPLMARYYPSLAATLNT